MNLYKLTTSISATHYYVVSADYTSAGILLKRYLDENKSNYSAIKNIELIASDNELHSIPTFVWKWDLSECGRE